MAATLDLAEKIYALKRDDIADDSRRLARQCLLDWMGCALAGSCEPVGDIMIAEFAASNAGHYGLIGRAEKAGLIDAALINGTCGHALDYDDNSTLLMGHPSVGVVPVVLALAQALDAHGEDILRAIIVGHEAGAAVGRFTELEHYLKGYHATGTIGTFGAAAAAAYLLELEPNDIAAALSLAGTQAAGLKAMFGTMAKPFHAGKAAANGLMAARLVKRGFAARNDILEVKQGFKHVTSTGDSAVPIRLDDFGKNIQKTTFKYHAACYGTHSAIEAALAFREKYNITDIDGINVHVPKAALDMCNIPDPQEALETKFSLRHAIAMALAGVDTAALENFSAIMAQDKNLTALRQKITVHGDDTGLGGGLYARLSFQLGDEQVEIEKDVSVPLSDFDKQEEKLRAKFASLAGAVIGTDKACVLEDKILHLESINHIDDMLSLACA